MCNVVASYTFFVLSCKGFQTNSAVMIKICLILKLLEISSSIHCCFNIGMIYISSFNLAYLSKMNGH